MGKYKVTYPFLTKIGFDMKSFIDESPFQGWVEYMDDEGIFFRRENKGTYYSFFKKNEYDNCYIHFFRLKKNKDGESIRQAHYRMIKEFIKTQK